MRTGRRREARTGGVRNGKVWKGIISVAHRIMPPSARAILRGARRAAVLQGERGRMRGRRERLGGALLAMIRRGVSMKRSRIVWMVRSSRRVIRTDVQPAAAENAAVETENACDSNVRVEADDSADDTVVVVVAQYVDVDRRQPLMAEEGVHLALHGIERQVGQEEAGGLDGRSGGVGRNGQGGRGRAGGTVRTVWGAWGWRRDGAEGVRLTDVVRRGRGEGRGGGNGDGPCVRARGSRRGGGVFGRRWGIGARGGGGDLQGGEIDRREVGYVAETVTVVGGPVVIHVGGLRVGHGWDRTAAEDGRGRARMRRRRGGRKDYRTSEDLGAGSTTVGGGSRMWKFGKVGGGKLRGIEG